MLSKLGDLEAADATKYLTSTLNGYKMEAEDATSVVDKLVAVDNVAATSVRELATALQYSAAIASETGVSFEQLVSYIGVVSETTRQNAESIGQGMKTMLTRMQDIKGGKLDEDGLGINNVEIALKKANIELRDSRDSFRDFGGVLEELAGKWGTLSETEQAFIAKSIAGVRQVNMFTVLMQNMGRAIELQEVQFSSAGLAADRYQIYLDSLEAKIAQLKATWEGLIQDTITSGFVGSLLDAGKAVLDFIEKIGGLKNSVLAITSVFALLKLPALIGVIQSVIVTIQALTASTAAITPAALMSAGSMEALGVSSAAAGATASAAMAAATLGISLLIAALVAAGVALERFIITTKEYAELANETEEDIQDTKSKIQSVSELQDEYEKLTEKINDLTLSEDELNSAQSRWYEVQKQLHSQIPMVTGAIDEQGRFIIANTEAITDQIKKLEELKTSQEDLMKSQATNYLFSSDYNSLSSFEKFFVDLNLDAKDGLNSLQQTVADALNAIDSFLLGYESKAFGILEFDTDATRNNNKSMDYITSAYSSMENATDVEDYLSKKESFDEIYAMTSDMMGKAGKEGALKYAESFNERWGEEYPILAENFYAIAKQVGVNEEEKLAKENAEAYRKEYIEILQKPIGKGFKTLVNPEDNKEENVMGRGLTEAQAQKWVDIGISGSQEITDYLITERIPSLIKAAQDLSNVFDTIGQKQLIAPEQIDRLGNFGVSVEYTADGLQVLKDKQGNVISSQEDLLNIIKLSESEYTSYSAEQQKIIDMYIEQALATEKASEGYKNLESAVNALSSAYKEQSENGEISISTAMNLVEAGMAEAVMWDTATGSLKLNEEAMIRLQKAKIEMAIADQRLITTTAGFTQAQVDAAQAMISAYQEIYNALGQGSPIANLSPVSGSSSAKQEDPRIKEQEEIIEGLEDEIDLYEDEKDAIKKSQDQYHDWIDLKKKALELTKEENDYLKEQSERTTNLAKLKKEIAMLELDNTEEARAKRLELEEQAAELEKEITENTEERRYDLQMQALENLKDAFDAMIEKQIEAIDLVIEGIRDQIEAIRDIIEDLREEGKSGGSGAGGTRNTSLGVGMQTWLTTQKPTDVNNTIVTDKLVFPVSQEPLITGRHEEGPIDIRSAYDEDKNVYAMQSGTIVGIGNNGGYGNTIAIKDANGRIVTTSHMSQLGNLQVGQNVNAGDIIGQVDQNWTGQGTGEHLHLEVWQETENGLERVNIGLEDFAEGFDYANAKIPEFNQNLDDLSINAQGAVNTFKEGSILIQDASGKINESATSMANKFIDLGATTADDLADIIQLTNEGYINWNGNISDITDSLSNFGYSIGLTGMELAAFINYMRDLQNNDIEETTVFPNRPYNHGNGMIGIRKPGEAIDMVMHSGGVVESHHDGNFAGNLQSNEVFAKLLKGEYVATEGQMDNFLKNVLPTIATNIPTGRYNQSSNITVSMPINVNGNLDKSVLPDIKKIANQVIEEINRSLIARGYVRPANNTLS